MNWQLHDVVAAQPPPRTPRTQRQNQTQMTAHDDEILGKAYDARLMRRLAFYLRPYWRQVALSFVAIIIGAAAQLAQPYLMKVAIDRYIATGQLAPLDRLAALYFLILVVAFAADYLQTWTMQLTGQKLMFDVRK